jgi:hypothetical protein
MFNRNFNIKKAIRIVNTSLVKISIVVKAGLIYTTVAHCRQITLPTAFYSFISIIQNSFPQTSR